MVIIYKLAILHSYTKLPEDRYITLNHTQIMDGLIPNLRSRQMKGLYLPGNRQGPEPQRDSPIVPSQSHRFHPSPATQKAKFLRFGILIATRLLLAAGINRRMKQWLLDILSLINFGIMSHTHTYIYIHIYIYSIYIYIYINIYTHSTHMYNIYIFTHMIILYVL